ncbi:MAG: tRNA 2-thiouridine(34) synthase MnmA [Verrucomicrobia bacterium]|nr:tRNA 2-thiouridine(34) synthase MnmA [Verrucomicrobiota bacterium]
MTNHLTPQRQTIAVGMSGGVDSTMAACLLKRQGFDVVGVTMQIWDGSVDLPATERHSGCYGPGEAQDLEELRALTTRLGIRHVTIPLAAEYRQWVLDYFRREYLAGHTPNPCVMCNWKLKFGLLLEKAHAAGLAFDRFATGHYARVEGGVAHTCGATHARYVLKRGLDTEKDQSYFLYHLTQDQLCNLVFPLGALKKTEVKALARELGLAHLAARPESQDFIECKHYGALFKDETIWPGPIVDRAGRVLGEHKGIIYYTIGQRKGLGLSGTKEPLYVVHINGPGNTIMVGPYEDLFNDRLRAEDMNWIAFDTLRAPVRMRTPVRVQAKIRQQHKQAAATVTPDGPDGHTVTVVFEEPQMAIAPGQAVVFYQDELVLGGGTIV